ncbi:MAG: hypothetical protein SP1CHLAM54_05560 [Chlamydiia bacterium]|nr:hypothetical protein [Chlamydiia bacterium]MCH9615466.1 hypothetical protein [Chlamydiia bacterium]MCH9629121.1 hypothetical protein [Chlamydiia bacterium]
MKRYLFPLILLIGCTGKTITTPKFDPKLKYLCDASAKDKAGYKLMCQTPMRKQEALILFREAVQETSIKRQVKPDDLYMRLTFWDKDMERPKAPFVAELIYINGEIQTYYKKPNEDSLTDSFDVDPL